MNLCVSTAITILTLPYLRYFFIVCCAFYFLWQSTILKPIELLIGIFSLHLTRLKILSDCTKVSSQAFDIRYICVYCRFMLNMNNLSKLPHIDSYLPPANSLWIFSHKSHTQTHTNNQKYSKWQATS